MVSLLFAQPQGGLAPLAIAIDGKHWDLVPVLLAAHADPNVHLPRGTPALVAACEAGNVDVVRQLVAVGANLEAQSTVR